MKIDFIPFQIGMQYENWEFDLEPINLSFKISYDQFIYFKKDIKELFGIEIQDIHLYFNLDILFKVEIIFKSKNQVQDFIYLATELEKKYSRQVLVSKNDKLTKTWKDPKKHLIIEHNFKNNQLKLMVLDKKYIEV
ncbi:hypothetical protein [Kordia sp.]|uniref:hypothetical protein n=1 Tax=Kordia sp. TaxID=1965332 RepID=UPI003B597265